MVDSGLLKVGLSRFEHMRNGVSNSQASGRVVLAATILGSSMAFLDGTVVNVALPALQNAFHATITNVQWVVESYALFVRRCSSWVARWETPSVAVESTLSALPFLQVPLRGAAWLAASIH
jgi:hypothetical protein